MALARLQVTDFRCLQSAAIDLDPRFTLISGANASGKTSLLEAVYVLGRGRSFRTSKLDHLIRRGSGKFTVFGEVSEADRRVPLGVEGSKEGLAARIGGAKPASLAELSLSLPVQIIDPEVHHLIDEGPSRRRRFLDYGTFHVEPRFVFNWQRYQQALKQRNAALKLRQAKAVVSIWDADLLDYGERISVARQSYVGELANAVSPIGRRLLGMELQLSYRTGWLKDLTMPEALKQNWQHDLEGGVTQIGPHRAEMEIRLDGVGVKDRISRGQQKLLASALLLGQLRLLSQSTAAPTLLLDDPAAELDHEKLSLLIAEVSSLPVQLIVTTLRGEFSAFGTPGSQIVLPDGL